PAADRRTQDLVSPDRVASLRTDSFRGSAGELNGGSSGPRPHARAGYGATRVRSGPPQRPLREALGIGVVTPTEAEAYPFPFAAPEKRASSAQARGLGGALSGSAPP